MGRRLDGCDRKRQHWGTAYNGAAFSTVARVGSHAGTFDGVNDYTNVKSSALVANSAQNSVEAWVYLTAPGAPQNDIRRASIRWGCLHLGVAPTVSRFLLCGGQMSRELADPESGAPVSINQWHHIVGTLGWERHENLCKTVRSAGMHTNTSPSNGTITEVSIGRVSNPGGTDFLAGKIDEVVAYKRALTAEEIQAYYNHPDSADRCHTFAPFRRIQQQHPLLNYSVSHGTVTVKVDGVVVNKLSGTPLGPLADGLTQLR